MELIDEQVGAVVAELKRAGLYENFEALLKEAKHTEDKHVAMMHPSVEISAWPVYRKGFL